MVKVPFLWNRELVNWRLKSELSSVILSTKAILSAGVSIPGM